MCLWYRSAFCTNTPLNGGGLERHYEHTVCALLRRPPPRKMRLAASAVADHSLLRGHPRARDMTLVRGACSRAAVNRALTLPHAHRRPRDTAPPRARRRHIPCGAGLEASRQSKGQGVVLCEPRLVVLSELW
jgi:hypothetical protein